MILDISHVGLQVPDLDASVEFAIDTLGMHEVARIGRTSYLTHASPYPSLGCDCSHHVVEFIEGAHAAFDHVGLVVRDREALEQVRARAEAAGGTILRREPDGPGLGEAIRLAAPSGHVFEIHTEMQSVSRSYVPRGLLPHRLGHVTFRARDVPGFMRFLEEAFGFRMTDWIGNDDGPTVGFARCHYEHHTLGANTSPVDGLHHIAFETASSVEIGLLGDHLARSGRQYIWGPGRHGVGDNIAAYFAGPDGIVIEIYAGMQRIIGDSWRPRSWKFDDPGVANMWSPPASLDALMATRVPLAASCGCAGDSLIELAWKRLGTSAGWNQSSGPVSGDICARTPTNAASEACGTAPVSILAARRPWSARCSDSTGHRDCPREDASRRRANKAA